MKSKILILFLILCLIMSVSAVSANEVNKTDKLTSTVTDVVSVEKADTNIQSNNKLNDVAEDVLCSNNNSNEKISLKSTNEDILEDDSGSFAELNKLIKTTPNELVLNKNYVFKSTDSCLEITKNNYVLDCNGYTLDANSSSVKTVIKVTGKNVVIKNMKFINGQGTYTLAGPYLNGLTGSIDWDGDYGVLDNVSISNSQYVIGWHGKYGILNNSIIKNCVNTVVIFTGEHFLFSNSVVYDNTHLRDDRPLIILNSYSTAFNCIFDNPDGNQMLGLGANSGQFNCKVLYCDFYNGYEAVVPMAVASSIEHCTFTRVSSDTNRAVIYLAGVSVNTLIDDCIFTQCTPTGGGIVGYNNNNIFTLSNSKFIGNSAIYLSNGNNILNCHVENNTFSSNLYGNTGTITNCNFTNNRFTHGTNNHVILAANTVVRNCNFINNVGCSEGIICVNDVNNLLRVYNSNFVTNNAYNGWAITATVSNSKFYENGNTYNKNNPIKATTPDRTLLNNLWVTSKSVTGGSGTRTDPFNLGYGISIVDYGGTVNFLNDGVYTITSTITISKPITLNGNGVTITNPNGLAIELKGGAVNSVVNYLTFKDCGKNTRGSYGAIYNGAHCVIIANSSFINNAGSNTGAIRLSTDGAGRLSVIDNCTFKSNVGDFGAVSVGGSVCTVSNSRFENNIGTYVGAIYVWNANDNNVRNLGFTLTNCNFTNNIAESTSVKNDYYGVYPVGAVSISSTNTEVSSCRFEKNSAYITGALCMNKAEKVIDCVFIENSATQYGGGLYMASDNAEIINCIFIKNKQVGAGDSSYGGGAIYVSGNNLYIEGSSFDSNVAQYGSAIWTKDELSYSLTISNSNFTKHASTVINLNDYSSTIQYCNFISNTAQVIQCLGSANSQRLVVSNSNFKFNKINSGNGVAINSMSSTSVDNCNFINNTAGVGIVYLNYDNSDVQKSNFINNTASWASSIFVNANNIRIKLSNFTNNRVTSTELSGTVYVAGDYTLITESNFTDNRGNIRGAAVYIGRSSSERFYYYIDSFTTNTCGNLVGYNDIYSALGQKLMDEVYVVLNPDAIPGSDKSGIDQYNPTYFEIGFSKVAPKGRIIFVNANEIFTSFTVDTSEHNKGESYKGFLFVCEKEGVKFCGKNTTFVNLRFSISSNSYGVEFSNITFKGCNNTVLIWNSENGIIDNCVFKDNTGEACVKGGAIQVLSNNLTIKNSVFNNNAVKSDNDPVGGGAIYCNVIELNIINSSFTSNIADNGAHILFDEYDGEINKEMISIINSSFNKGMKYTLGGSSLVFNHGNVIILNCNFTSNSIDKDGGVILIAQSVQNVKLENNSFINNKAINGGAIAFSNVAHKQISIINNYFSQNVATNYGGAIAILSSNINDLVMLGNYFKNNNATKGGAIYTNAKIVVNNSNFVENNASKGGAIYLDNGASFTKFNYCNFTKNLGDGSAINIYSGNVTIDHCIFIKNIGTNFGTIDSNSASASDLIIKNSEFYNNSANVAAAICFTASGNNMWGINLTFEGNTAISSGGACSLRSKNSGIIDSMFKNNTCQGNGGALVVTGNNFKVSNCEFIKNSAINGGAIYISVSNVNVSNCNFTDNIAITGGAIYIDSDNVKVTGCNFKGNNASNGSAIFIASGKNGFDILDSNFENNKATDHGTVYLVGATGLKLGANTFKNNIPSLISENYYGLTNYIASVLYISQDGGGNGLTEDSPITLENALNILENGGKLIFLTNIYVNQLNINKNITLVGNGYSIKRDSKYLLTVGDNLVLNISDMILNQGIVVSNGGTLNLNNITFTGTSDSEGGIIYNGGSQGSIINSKFTNLVSLGDNHIVTVNGNVDISNSEFTSNSISCSSLYYGSTGSGSITNSVFSDNHARNDVRNINITNINNVILNNNTFDVNVTYKITNSTYSSLAYVNGTFDAGVNFDIKNVLLIINDTAKLNKTVNIGASDFKFSFDIGDNLAVGIYNLTVSLNDGNSYDINYFDNNFAITKANVLINDIDSITVIYGENDTIVLSGSVKNNIYYTNNNYTGFISIILGDNDAVNTTVDKNGSFTVNFNVKGFDVGVYALNITIAGNSNFSENNKVFNNYLNVEKATIDITEINNITVDYGVDYVVVNGTFNSTKFGVNYAGNVTVSIAGLSNRTLAINGTFSIRITNSTPFKVGKYDIIVSGETTDEYNAVGPKTFSDAFEVLSIVPEFVVTSPSIGYGENATVFIKLPADATGKVVINASGKYVVVIDNVYGVTNATIVLPLSGSYLINATYYGDDNYQSVSTNSTLFVERPRTSLNITVEDVFVGSDVLINFNVLSAVNGKFFDDAGGVLRVYVGSSFYSVNITKGRGNLTVSGLGISAYNVVAIYNGDDNYAGCDAYDNFQVKGYETFLNITLNKYEIFVGGNISVNVKVNDTINNYPIYLYIDGELFGILLTNKGAVVFNVDGLSAGVHNISAVFPATSAFGNTSNKTTVNVVKNNPHLSTEAIANSTNDVFIKFNLPDDATGVINVTYEGVVIKSIVVDGNRTISLGKYSTVGNYTFSLFYSGDEKYSESLSNSTVELGKISDYVMNITSTVIVRNKNVTIFVNLPDEFMNNGTVNLTINGDSEVISLVNSQVNKTITTVGLDVINVVATYSGFDNYAFKTISRVFEIKPTDEYEIRIIVDDACVGDNVTIKISAPEEINNVTLRVDAIGEVINLVNGNGSYNLSSVALGYHTIIVSYDGDDLYYTAKTFYGGFNVTRKVPVITVTADNVTYQTPVPVSVDLGEKDVSGLVSIVLDGKVYNYFELVDGKVKFNISDLNAGVHNIVVKYAGDDKYSNVTSQVVLFNITKTDDYDMDVYYDSKLVVNGSMVDSGSTNQLIISVELPKNAVGNVSLFIDGHFVNSINATKNLIFTLGDYPTGIHNVSVVYDGDRNYNSSSFTFELNVTSKLPANLIIVCPSVIHVNDRFNITIDSNLDDDVLVSLFVDGAKFATQKVSSNFTIDGLSSGNHFITVNFDGNMLFHGGSNSTNISVIKWDSVVSVSAEDIDVGQNLVVDVNASGNGSAKIYIYNSASDLVADYILSIDNGKGRIIVPYTFTEIGEYKINITYNGDDVYNVSKNNTSFIVSLASDYDFKVITSDALVGDNVTVDVILPNNANKNVILKLANGTTLTQKLVNGTTRFVLPALVAGDYIVNATYEGDNNYNMSTKLGKFTIFKHDSVVDLSFNTTDMSGVEIINSIVQGEKTILIIKLANDTTGYVNVTVSSTKQFNNRYLVNGEVNITLDDLTHGNYNIKVDYSGDNKYNNATSTIVLIVASYKPSIEITPIGDQMVGSDVVVSVKTNVDKGNVTLYLNGVVFNTTGVVDGWANFTIKSISGDLATFNVFVVYEANDEYAGVVNSTTFNVNKFSSSFDVNSFVNNVTVCVDVGATGSVIVSFNGVNYTAVVNASGVAVISLPNVPGSYKLPVYYSGDSKYYANSTIVDVNIPWGDNYILNATVDSAGLVTINADSRVDNVTISCEGLIGVITEFTVKGDIKVGYYQLPADLAVGSHIVTVSYDGDSDLGPKSYSLIYDVEKIKDYQFNITAKADYVGNDAVVYVNLPDDATGFVIFTINGKGYSINLAESRNLTLSGLTNGTYSVVAKYMGDGNYSENQNTTEFTLIKRASSVDISVNDIKVGQVETITVNVSNNINGMVLLNINGDKYYVDIVNGTGSVNLTKLSNGTYTVNAFYDGNEIYEPSNTTRVFNVTKISDYNIDADYSKVVNNATKVTVTLPGDATGLVTITVNNTNFTGVIYKGKAVVEVTNITAPSYDYVVNWEGDDKYVAGRATGVIYNDAYRKDSQVIVSVDDIYVDGSALIKVNVTNGATGEVRISVNGRNIVVPLVNGSVKYSIGGFAIGTFVVNVTYLGDRQFAQSTNSTTFKVSKYNSTISIITDGGSVDEHIVINIIGPGDASGDVEILINGTKYSVVMNNGRAVLNTTFAKYGSYNIIVNYSGDVKYNSISNVSSFSIDSLTPGVVVSVDDIKVGQDAIVTVIVPDDASGIVTVTVNGVDYNVSVNEGKAVFTISNLGNGTYNILAKYNGDNKYAVNTNTSSFNVSKVDIVPDVTSTLIVEKQTNITVSLQSDATGNITLFVNGESISSKINGGVVQFNLNDVVNGTEVRFVYDGDDKYNKFNTSATLYESGIKLSSELSIMVSNIRVGDDAVITVSVTDKATGNITITIDDKVLSKEIVDGKVTFTVSDLAYGTYNVTAIYSGDNKFLESNITSSISVAKHDSFVVVSVVDIKVGDNATITVNIVPNDATGNVSLKINGIDYDPVNVSDGKAIFTVSGLGNGSYIAVVTYNGNAKYLNSTGNASFNVSKVDINVNVESTSVLETNTTVTVSVPNDAAGNITIFVGDKTFTGAIDDGKAVINLTGVSDGTNITIIYAGNDKYNGFNKIATVTDKGLRINSQITVTTDKDEYLAGETAVITITVPDDATGNVTIRINKFNDTGIILEGKVIYYYVVPTSGDFIVEVIYNGDSKYAKVENTTSFTASKVNSTVIISVDTVQVGDNATIIVTVPDDARGQITINVGSFSGTGDIVDGKVVFNVSSLVKGSHTVSATFIPSDSKYNGNSNSTSFEVVARETSMVVDVESGSYGDKVNITVTLPDDSTGYVTITIGDNSQVVNLKNGIAQLNISNLEPGTFDIVVSYDGDDNYNKVSNSSTFTIERKTTNIDVSAGDINKGDVAVITVIVPIDATGIITITIGGNQYNKTIDNGFVVFEIVGLGVGTYNIVAVYAGDKYYVGAVNDTVSFSVLTDESIVTEVVTRAYGSAYDYEALFTDKAGNPLANTNVTFAVNGKEYVVMTDQNGIARLPGGTLGIGNHTVVAINPLTGFETHNTTVILPRVAETTDIVMDFNDGTGYSVRVLGDDGNPVGAGVEVTMNVHSMTYKVKTDANGYATLPIHLNPGKYTLGVEYGGFKVSNSLVVKQTFFAKKTQKIKKSKKKNKIKAQVKLSNGKPVKGVKLTMKLKGKNIKAKTNAKGVAKFKVPKKVVKKLKVGKKYKVSFTYLTNTIVKKIKVKR